MDPYKDENSENTNPVRDTGEDPYWFVSRSRPILEELRQAQYQSNDGRPPRRRVSLDQIHRLVFGIRFEEREVRAEAGRVEDNGNGAWQAMNEEQPQEEIVEQDLPAEEMDIQNRLNEIIERGIREIEQGQQLEDDNHDELQNLHDIQDFLPDNHAELPDMLDVDFDGDDQEN